VSLPDRTFDDADYDPASALASARQRAWYLEEQDDLPITSSQEKDTTKGEGKAKDQPNFVTFDPDRTTTSRASSKIKPLPTDAPAELGPLHEWLTSRDAAYVLDTSSVVFLNTKTAGKHMVGEGEVIKVDGVDIAAPVWEWIVVAVVKGRGKGVVGRAERALRIWVSAGCCASTSHCFARTGIKTRIAEAADCSCTKTRLGRWRDGLEARRANSPEYLKRPTGPWSKYLNYGLASTCSPSRVRRGGTLRVCGGKRGKEGKKNQREGSGSQKSQWADGDCTRSDRDEIYALLRIPRLATDLTL